MRKRALLAITALVAAGFAIAGAAAPPTQSVELPTSPLERLIATGELPADVTGAPGVWNFAGPASACPGPGWNCETLGASPVVQNGTVNVVSASDDCPKTEQNGVVNKIECVDESPTAHQTCGPFDQDGTHNELICKLIYDVTSTEPTQCAFQEGHFEQSGPLPVNTDASETNKFKGELRIVQQQSSGGTQTQDARQRINGKQRAKQSNESEIQEVQIQKLTGSATTQNQNTGCPTPPPPTDDCNPVFDDPPTNTVPLGPTTPYTCVNLEQRVDAGGVNLSKLKQEVRQDAQTSSAAATETQGTIDGGNDARVIQEIVGGGSKNLGLADQYTYQTLPVRSAFVQKQFEDPFCCGSTSGGGEDSEERAKQWVQQLAGPTGPLDLQHANALGTSSSDGVCEITHSLQNNGGDAQTSQSDEGGCDIMGTTTCEGAPVEGFCTSTNCPEGESFSSNSGRCEELSELTLRPFGRSAAGKT